MLSLPPAPPDLTPYLAKTEFNPALAELVWSGSATKVPMSSLSEGGPGLYAVVYGGAAAEHYMIYVRDVTKPASGAAFATTFSTNNTYCHYYGEGAAIGEGFLIAAVRNDNSTQTLQTLNAIYKV